MVYFIYKGIHLPNVPDLHSYNICKNINQLEFDIVLVKNILLPSISAVVRAIIHPKIHKVVYWVIIIILIPSV